ncbi:MAG TPA: hypothetical protein VFZ22_03460 [Pyrinomonadaceae bacterium]|nr:hypothetical protein [Pyrinomonadaceae bacterium]
MKKLIPLLLLSLLFAASAFADSRAEEVLKQAREAIGGDRLQKVETLHIDGKYRRVLGDRQMAGDREISIQLPNKYLVEDAMSMGGMSTSFVNTRGLNGERAWSGSSGGGNMVFRMGGGPGGAQATPEQIEAAQRRIFQAEFSRYLLAMILTAPSSLAVEYKYAGESEVEDAQADVVDVTGPDKFSARIFFDKTTHLPLLLSYRGPKPRIMTMTRQGGAPGSAEEVKKAREEAEKKMQAEAPAVPEEVEFFIRLSDHKKVDGLMLPYKLTFLTESEVSEEFEISKYQVNPQFKADKFEKH